MAPGCATLAAGSLRYDPSLVAKLFKNRPKRRRTTDQVTRFTDQVAAGCLIEASIAGRGNYLVQGEVIGGGEIDGAVVMAAGAFWKGDLAADYVKVAGKIEGSVTARIKLELEATAMVTGDLASPVIAIAEGAVYEGAIRRPRATQVTRYVERRGNGDNAASG